MGHNALFITHAESILKGHIANMECEMVVDYTHKNIKLRFKENVFFNRPQSDIEKSLHNVALYVGRDYRLTDKEMTIVGFK